MAPRAWENLLQPLHLELVRTLKPERLSLMTCPKLQATMANVLQNPPPLRLIVYTLSNTLCYLHYRLKVFFFHLMISFKNVIYSQSKKIKSIHSNLHWKVMVLSLLSLAPLFLPLSPNPVSGTVLWFCDCPFCILYANSRKFFI